MELIDLLKEYKPFNSKEENDKKKFIDFLLNNNNVFTRLNTEGHVTSSCWILNKTHDKALMCYHNIYDSFSWLGGHNDGNEDCLNVAIKELKEESGLQKIKVLSNDIFSIEILPVKEHIKKGKLIKEHLHYNITYIFECDELEKTRIKKDENKQLAWFNINDLKDNVKEKNMYENVYSKLIAKSKQIKSSK